MFKDDTWIPNPKWIYDKLLGVNEKRMLRFVPTGIIDDEELMGKHWYREIVVKTKSRNHNFDEMGINEG